MLSCSQVSLSRWKTKYLSDTESDPGLSSEDEAVGLPLHKAVAQRLPGSRGRETVQTSTSTPATGTQVRVSLLQVDSLIFLNLQLLKLVQVSIWSCLVASGHIWLPGHHKRSPL